MQYAQEVVATWRSLKITQNTTIQ